ncbi:MAG: type II toxin-antitoxin system RelE/ParE family toxin [Bifidobacteriaceae bacterium]|nr:type II toxin-antitoxin system RelE/ParE family toxin [Bifidobacteriaceae bacterium]
MTARITRLAEQDLPEIGDYIARDKPERALSFIAELRATCAGLETFPEAHPVADGLESVGVRRHAHKRYAVYHRVRGGKVELLRVLHQSRDHLAAFG